MFDLGYCGSKGNKFRLKMRIHKWTITISYMSKLT